MDHEFKNLDQQDSQDKPLEKPEKSIDQKKEKASGLNGFFSYKKSFLIFGLVIILGIITGYGYAYINSAGQQQEVNNNSARTQEDEVAQTVGIADKKTFKDSATGILREGGMDGEGSYHLERPGGESQNVYLTSSTVDLSKHLGQKVTVHGETFAAQKAGWLMDVGLVEILE